MPFSCCTSRALVACFETAFAFCSCERLAMAACFRAAFAFCGREWLGVAASFGAAMTSCGCGRLVLASFLDPADFALAPLALAACRPGRLAFGRWPWRRWPRPAVTSLAFDAYPATTFSRPLLSFGQRSISYRLPSNPNAHVWTSAALPHTS